MIFLCGHEQDTENYRNIVYGIETDLDLELLQIWYKNVPCDKCLEKWYSGGCVGKVDTYKTEPLEGLPNRCARAHLVRIAMFVANKWDDRGWYINKNKESDAYYWLNMRLWGPDEFIPGNTWGESKLRDFIISKIYMQKNC